MCGIVGQISRHTFPLSDTLMALERLEYRGYDSVGIATNDGFVYKEVGGIGDFIPDVPKKSASVAISHTRWATHGKVTRENAHPHVSSDGNVTLVHNGIIENYEELKTHLQSQGWNFASQTDTEVIANYIASMLKDGMDVEQSIRSFMDIAKGTFAVLMLVKGDSRLYAFKRDSPLVLGILDNGYIISSDIYAFSDRSSKAIYFEDGEYAIFTEDSYSFFISGTQVRKDITEVSWTGTVEKGVEYDHFMIKEIHEQPEAASRLIGSFDGLQLSRMKRLYEAARSSKRILFVAAGTSYHASLIGVYILNSIGISAHSLIASEFQNYMLADKDALVIAISQSGETMDVVTALKYAKDKGARIASIVNVPYSTIQRLSDISVEILAGQEICVASTKTYTNQVLTLLKLGQMMGYDTDLLRIPADIRETIDMSEKKVAEMASTLKDVHDMYIIGRGVSYPLAREVALKLKEIAYIHAEGMMGGELKHGTIALIEAGTIVFSFIQDSDLDMVSNTEEVEARGAHVIMASDNPEFGPTFLIPKSSPGAFSITSAIIGQLFAYYIAKEKGLPIDKPRNLAKSVTVK